MCPGAARSPAAIPTSRTGRPPRWSCCSTSASWSASPRSRPSWHHGVAEDHVAASLGHYLMVFFAIWWAWMNFTWFASAYDTDDVVYRLLTLVQIAGVLVLAAGVPAAFEHNDFTVVTIGYVIMRLPLVAQWLRAARDDPSRRAVAVRYADRRRGRAGALAAPAGAPGRPPALIAFFAARLARHRGADLGRAGRADDPLASRTHRRAVRAVHADRARRGDPGRDDRHPGRAHQRGRVRGAAQPRRRRPAAGLRALVGLLPPPGRRRAAGDAAASRSSGATGTTSSSPRSARSGPGSRSRSGPYSTRRTPARGPRRSPWRCRWR